MVDLDKAGFFLEVSTLCFHRFHEVEDHRVHQGEATIFDLCHQCCTCGNGLGFLLPTLHVKPNAIKSVAVLLSTMRWGCQC